MATSWPSQAINDGGGGHPLPDLFCPTIRVPLRATKVGAGERDPFRAFVVAEMYLDNSDPLIISSAENLRQDIQKRNQQQKGENS